MALVDPLAEFRLDGEVAVVTGGASGIGEVVAGHVLAIDGGVLAQ
jgi:NAD(P)-dependent dehydrogenase (short-subunit alcohol dehydrogenase family)